jgi:hypothetical protein
MTIGTTETVGEGEAAPAMAASPESAADAA